MTCIGSLDQAHRPILSQLHFLSYCNWQTTIRGLDALSPAAAYLPLSESNLIPKELGTRHRAAVGISEVTDALTIVVSEETGGVTITKNNELIRDLTQQDYRKLLYNELVPTQEEKTNAVARFFTEIFGIMPR